MKLAATKARMKAGISLLTLCVLLALAPLGCPLEADEADATPDRPAPDFTLEKLGGGEVTLAELRGKTVVLDFWATWCAPCEFQVPGLNSFFDAHRGDHDVAIYGVSVDVEGPEVVAEWVGEKAVRYPILLGGENVARSFGALGFPTLIVISPDGMVHSQHVGLIEVKQLEEALTVQRTAASS